MIFVTSDWHFSHDREFVYKSRGFNSVEEMNVALIERHNSIVTPEDDVYVLGDLCLGGADGLERNKEFISSMNGKLHIAFGNHCTDSRKKMYAKLPNVMETAWAIALSLLIIQTSIQQDFLNYHVQFSLPLLFVSIHSSFYGQI
jgi:calcineurin-like phosphoesterase family protein